MKLHELNCSKAEKKSKKRRGRGSGSGLGCTAGKGNKGQKARAGSGPSIGFEGGQMPLCRRLPKYGFNNKKFQIKYNIINLDQLEQFIHDNEYITVDQLSAFLKSNKPIKILGKGSISKQLQVEAHKFSNTAIKKIEDAGGKVVSLEVGK